MFQIKICGVRRIPEIVATAAAGADAVGLNFYRPSSRYIEPELAIELSHEADELGLSRIGVFVDEAVEKIVQISDKVGLDFVQLHGFESLETAQRLVDAGERIIRAVRLPVGRLETVEIEDRVAPWRELGCDLLLDADAGVQAGGAGLRLDWAAIGRWRAEFGKEDSWVLAGGLTPQTVGKAISLTGAKGVDVASGVEQPRGVKSPALIESFVKSCGYRVKS
jgi:phosphoribosylanthranilate isomerase